MELQFLAFFLFILIAVHGAADSKQSNKIRYDNFVVYKIKFNNAKQRDLLENLVLNRENYNLWHSADGEMHLMVNPQKLSYFKNFTRSYGMKNEVLISNVQSLIDEEETAATTDDLRLSWIRYHPLADIERFLDEMLASFPDVSEGFTIGKSYEGRSIRGIKISYKKGNPGVFIESNIHAREWVTSATTTWLINELLTSTDPDVRELAENHDWYIVPVLNVDGFVYTHEKDRMWRKTRQPSATSTCIGADGNRNFDSHWMENGGASANPCSETYAGPMPFSEPEIKGLANYVADIKDRINILVAFHSYGQYLLSPYGHTAEEFPDNYDDLMQVAKAYSDSVDNLPYNTKYVIGSSAGALYVASGATLDWAYNEQDIKITYTIEFRDKGRYGFILPTIQILPNCQETMAGIIAMTKEAKGLGYMQIKY